MNKYIQITETNNSQSISVIDFTQLGEFLQKHSYLSLSVQEFILPPDLTQLLLDMGIIVINNTAWVIRPLTGENIIIFEV